MNEKSSIARILIIEDSPVIALAIEEMLRTISHVPLGPIGNMASALEFAESEQMDAAIVDLNIRGTKTFTLLSILDRRAIPFLIITGYADWKMPDEWVGRARLQKPFTGLQLEEKLIEILPST